MLPLHTICDHHDHPTAGHFGETKTMELICCKYHWPGLRCMVKDYVKSCTSCTHTKAPCHKPYGLLKQLPIPAQPWESISMDFIKQLPVSEGFTAILVIVDRLTKQSLFIPTHNMVDAPQLAQMFLTYIFSKHGTLGHITSNCSVEFVSLLLLPGILAKHETPFHIRLPPRRQQPDGVDKPGTRTIPAHLYKLPAGQLGTTSPSSGIRIQQHGQCNHGSLPILCEQGLPPETDYGPNSPIIILGGPMLCDGPGPITLPAESINHGGPGMLPENSGPPADTTTSLQGQRPCIHKSKVLPNHPTF